MFRCPKCGVEHNRFRDRDKTRPASYCCACHAKFMRETRPKHSELSTEQKFKANARSYANVYQKRGKIEPEPCLICGAEAQKHHDDYSRPKEVSWLCREHHLALHQELTSFQQDML